MSDQELVDFVRGKLHPDTAADATIAILDTKIEIRYARAISLNTGIVLKTAAEMQEWNRRRRGRRLVIIAPRVEAGGSLVGLSVDRIG